MELPVGSLDFKLLRAELFDPTVWQLSKSSKSTVEVSHQALKNLLAQGKTVYGVNTGFGKLAQQKIPAERLGLLQHHLILSHAVGTGPDLSDSIVALIMLLKVNSLAQGYSGIRLEVIERLLALYNQRIYPCIPSQGSVGASGDLAPLAHMSCPLLGVGEVVFEQEKRPSDEVNKALKLQALELGPKEGLALLNGTQASTAIALDALFKAEAAFETALIAGALTVDAIRGSDKPFDPRIQLIRRSPTQSKVAELLTSLLDNSAIRASHQECDRVQDPYSVRCQPQVMGACLAQIRYASSVLEQEMNAVTDNPLIFSEQGEVVSGGNFHAEPVAFAADALAVAIAEIGSISERRIALLVDHSLSGLPAFLINNSGENSGFMIAQVTAAALVSENKHLAHAVSVDSIPTSANQEDHVSMATYAARRLHQMLDNLAGILAVELLAACQGIDFLRPLTTSPLLEEYYKQIRSLVPFYDKDRYMAPDLALVKELILSKKFNLAKMGDNVQLFI